MWFDEALLYVANSLAFALSHLDALVKSKTPNKAK